MSSLFVVQPRVCSNCGCWDHQEEEARLIAEEEAKEEAERKAVEEEKARKRAKAKEKVCARLRLKAWSLDEVLMESFFISNDAPVYDNNAGMI